MKWIAITLFSLLAVSCCHDDPIKNPTQTHIAILIVDENTRAFEGGKVYEYETHFTEYSLTVENVLATDFGYIKVFFNQNNNEMIYYATQIFMGQGQIHVPSPISPPDAFEQVMTSDFVMVPESAIELTNIGSGNPQDYWAVIQGLKLVRTALQASDSQIHYFRQSLDGEFTSYAKWIFIVKY